MKNNLFLLLTLLIFVAIGYVLYRYAGTTTPVAEINEAEFETRISQLRRLKNLQLDTSILEDKFFQNLPSPNDAVVTDPPRGRINPFASFTNQSLQNPKVTSSDKTTHP